MKILAVSDVESKYIWDYFDPEVFRDIDLIVSCGDLSAKYLSFLVTMIPKPLLYVPGNHDKRYATDPPEGCIPLDGRLLVWHGLRIMGFGGCKSQRAAAHEYTEEQMWRKVRRMDGAVRRAGGLDILVTHAPAIGLGDRDDSFHEGFEAFRWLDEVCRPRLHLYGHCHINTNPRDRSAVMTFGTTTLVNACGYRIVELDPAPPAQPPCPPPRSLPLFGRPRSFDFS